MYCYNCGKELNDDFNLCPYCGVELTQHFVGKAAGIEEECIEEPDVKFELLGRELFFSPRFLEYNALRKRFFEKAESLEMEYIRFYNGRKHTFVGLFEEEIPEVVQKITSAVRFGVDVLMEYGIDDVDDTMLANMVIRSGNIKESLGYIYAKAEEIQRYAENLGDSRDIKKASRGHWEGGGFGVTGAVKGAIVAGAFNLGTSAFHGVGDTLTKASDKAKISGMKQELAVDPRVATCLFDTVYDFSTKVFYCVEELLIENDIIDEYDFDEAGANARAKNYIARIASQASAENVEKAIDVLCECIQQAPYSTILYFHLYNLFDGNKEGIHSTVKMFGLVRGYSDMIVKNDMDTLNSILAKKAKTEKDVNAQIEEIERVRISNPFISVDDKLQMLQDQKQKLIILNESSHKIIAMRSEVHNITAADDLRTLWELANNGNVCAEEQLVEYYQKQCKPFYGYYNESEKIGAYVDSIRNICGTENLLAEFIILLVTNKIHTVDNIQQIAICFDSKKYAAPLYYTGFYAIRKRTPRGQYWNHDNNQVTSEKALSLMVAAAEMLYLPAIKYISELYTFGKPGLVKADVQKAEVYKHLIEAYAKQIVLKPRNNDSLAQKVKPDSIKYTRSEKIPDPKGDGIVTAAEKIVSVNVQVQAEPEKIEDGQEPSKPLEAGTPSTVEEQPAAGMATTPIEIADADQPPKADEKEQIVNTVEEVKIEPSRPGGHEQQAETTTDSVDNTAKNPTRTKVPVKKGHDKPSAPKSKIVAGLFTLFLGLVGAQWFYLNKPVRALIYLLITFASIFIIPGAVSIWQLFLLGESIFFFIAKAPKVEKYSKQVIRKK